MDKFLAYLDLESVHRCPSCRYAMFPFNAVLFFHLHLLHAATLVSYHHNFATWKRYLGNDYDSDFSLVLCIVEDTRVFVMFR